METAAKGLNVALVSVRLRVAPPTSTAPSPRWREERVDALTIIEDAGLIPSYKRIAELAVRQRLPSISFVEYADAGGLFGYGADYLALYRRAAVFVDKILKGAKPADIPVERPTTFEFVDQHEDRQGARLCHFISDPFARGPA